MAKPSEILRRGRELLQERGWVQGRLSSPNGYCALGAVYAASRELKGGRNRSVAVAHLAQVAAHRRGDFAVTYSSIFRYNDLPGRQKRHVLSLFDAAIRDAELREQAA